MLVAACPTSPYAVSTPILPSLLLLLPQSMLHPPQPPATVAAVPGCLARRHGCQSIGLLLEPTSRPARAEQPEPFHRLIRTTYIYICWRQTVLLGSPAIETILPCSKRRVRRHSKHNFPCLVRRIVLAYTDSPPIIELPLGGHFLPVSTAS